MLQRTRFSKMVVIALVTASLIIVKKFAVPTFVEASETILCNGEVHRNYNSTIVITDTSSQVKVIRDCQFSDSNVRPITIKGAKNVLIERSTFRNLDSGGAGQDIVGIYILGGNGTAENIVIQNNTFDHIGSDGVHLGDADSHIRNVTIQGNTFLGPGDSTPKFGENGVDIKGVEGPIFVRDNIFRGFRPCDSPKRTGGSQHCSGSPGEGMVVHWAKDGRRSSNVTVEGNLFENNTLGLSVNHSLNDHVCGNSFVNNKDTGLDSGDVNGLEVFNNGFLGNPTQVGISNLTNCVYSGNTFSGGGGVSWGSCKQIITGGNCQTNPPTTPPTLPPGGGSGLEIKSLVANWLATNGDLTGDQKINSFDYATLN